MIEIRIGKESDYITVGGDKDYLKNEILNRLPEQINILLDSVCSTYDEKFDVMRDFQVQIMKSTTFSKKDSAKAALDGIEHIIKKLNETQPELYQTEAIREIAKELTQPQQPKDQNIEINSAHKTKEDIIKMLKEDLKKLSSWEQQPNFNVIERRQIIAEKVEISKILLDDYYRQLV